jgi:hypothetical protein
MARGYGGRAWSAPQRVPPAHQIMGGPSAAHYSLFHRTLHVFLRHMTPINTRDLPPRVLTPRPPPSPRASHGLLRSVPQPWRPDTALGCPCCTPRLQAPGAPSRCHHPLPHKDAARRPSTLRGGGAPEDTGASAGGEGLALPRGGPRRLGGAGILGGPAPLGRRASWWAAPGRPGAAAATAAGRTAGGNAAEHMPRRPPQ